MRIELLLFLSFLTVVIVMIACSAPRRPGPAATSTLFAPLSLSTYDPHLIGRVSMEADVRTTLMPPKPGLPDLEISLPRCFRTISPQVTCFGAISNRMSSALSQVSLTVRYRVGLGRPSAVMVVGIEQRRVNVGGQAPYRLPLPGADARELGLELGLADAKIAAEIYRDLKFEEQGAAYVAAENSYRLRGLLWNASQGPVADIRLVATLEGEAGAIVGYRALDLDGALAAKESRMVDLSISPLEYARQYQHRVIAQAVAVD